MMGDIFANRVKWRRFALSGKIDFKKMYIVIAVTLAVSYISSIFFVDSFGAGVTHYVTVLGSKFFPAVAKAAEEASDPMKSSFVMSIQWALSVVYVYVWFVIYNPMSVRMRIATRVWYRRNERPPYVNIRLLALLLIGGLGLLGDVGLIDVPTLFNGKLFYSDQHSRLIVFLLDSPVFMPMFSWFLPLANITIYWACFYVLVNREVMFD
jgi:hypothetical protein